ncbi:glutamine--tRNA ligase [bacterium BMS3Abin04]|nr:glutamine--tRNA ligase [bacterium BMS3Abin04]
MGKREIPFSVEVFIERGDFKEEPHKKCYRLATGLEVRLRYAYIIKCEKVIKDEMGNVIEVQCTYDPETKSGGNSTKKVKGTIHWVSAKHAVDAEIRLYDRLFTAEDPSADKEKDFKEFLDPNSLEILNGCKVEPSLQNVNPTEYLQFERTGYFISDSKDSNNNNLVFNRTVSLRDSWAKISRK